MIELHDITALDLIKEKIPMFYLFAGTSECGYCNQLKQDMIDHEEFDETDVIFVDVDTHTKFADDMNVEYIPTLFVYKDGKIVESFNNVNDINLQTLKNTYG